MIALLAVMLAAAISVSADQSAKATKIQPKRVCMINNAAMPKDQIPVVVEGKTYYGCCPMCKERLARDAASRVAVDPVSGKSVDKATAVIGALKGGDVLYFENEKNLAAFNAGARHAPKK